MKRFVAFIMLAVMMFSLPVAHAENDYLDTLRDAYVERLEKMVAFFSDSEETFTDYFAHMFYTDYKMYLAADMGKQVQNEGKMILTFGEKEAAEMTKNLLKAEMEFETTVDEIWKDYMEGNIDSTETIKRILPFADAVTTAYRRVQEKKTE